jgi:hypothetical protein
VTAVLVVLGIVAVIALVLRAGASGVEPGRRRDPALASALDVEDDEPDDGDEFAEGQLVDAVAITTEGVAFVPHRGGLELIPPGEDEDQLREQAERHGKESIAQAAAAAPINPRTGRRLVQWRPGQSLSAGDVVAVRVVRGAPDVDPWRVECLGRDRDYVFFAFDSEGAARTAAELIQTRVLKPPRDEDGEVIRVGAEDFVVARRQYEETAEEAAMPYDPEDDPTR